MIYGDDLVYEISPLTRTYENGINESSSVRITQHRISIFAITIKRDQFNFIWIIFPALYNRLFNCSIIFPKLLTTIGLSSSSIALAVNTKAVSECARRNFWTSGCRNLATGGNRRQALMLAPCTRLYMLVSKNLLDALHTFRRNMSAYRRNCSSVKPL